ncbi:alanine--tRNA ligase [Pontibacter sp. BT310]|uniref:Alanine--tRNA ligase n=1 Tax=Pontibacter populi TaxID=890055 RepID=A0ABS6XFV7_9BACT|nr:MULTISPECIES: alanine--tRNA ligase [Pontibacter]MBJ6120024.1 alanine--tRNA ligase [Pontibacter sp. BT310]MBR0572453.1 alanine--tRNA ligase [Microvirga sp. STS03]MBW3366877.1 alanine--tRNA ligase [Pontibacter populi]
MNSAEIRQKFLDFFASKQHQIVPSAPIVVKDDPTLMFINSGMAPFKDYFLGNKPAPYKRIADTQKCLRVSGKHNDLEEVGYDTYHHTMFEMLGNWSFGDYFKKDALEWSWELLTKVYKLPKDRLYVSVFQGDASENLQMDQDAFNIWKTMIAEDRILMGNKKDNFWEMGDTGPCGPCSEIHVDLRTDEERAQVDGKSLVNNDHPQVVEIWNNVFMEFNRLADGSLVKLPAQHVDTGMGFERLCMAIQGKRSNYDTDVFQPLIQFVAKEAGVVYGENEKTDIAIRVISDHIRAIAFTIADGQLPSNNKAGYVIRRILRRAVRYGFTFLDFKKPFLYKLAAVLADQMETVFPELKQQLSFVQRVIEEEENAFLRTLENGLKRLDALEAKFKENNNTIDGKTAFELYDTFGFPLDLTALIAREKGLKVDEAGFGVEMEQQKNRSRNASASEQSDWVIVQPDVTTEFVGYDCNVSDSHIVRYRQVKTKTKSEYHIVLDRTPFYAESGGQVGDTGYLVSDSEQIEVLDTKKENDLILHITAKLPQNLEAAFRSGIDFERRNYIRKNHSATHLLHAALRKVLGDHVQQKGSLVNEKVLRFDFSHFSKVEDAELREIEHIVNERVRQSIPLEEQRNVPIAEAKEMGATALFGEKYGEYVRVIAFDREHSVELCGGTHVYNTGEIGYFKIVSESSVAAGVRRIEAVTATLAEDFVQAQLDELHAVREVLNTQSNVSGAVQKLQDDNKALQKQLEAFELKQLSGLKDTLAQKAHQLNGVSLVAEQVEVSNADHLKKLAFDMRQVVDNLILVLAAEIDGKPQIAVMLSDNLVAEKNLNASQMVRELAKEIKGGGGGQPFYATAGGKDTAGLQAVPGKAVELVKSMING